MSRLLTAEGRNGQHRHFLSSEEALGAAPSRRGSSAEIDLRDHEERAKSDEEALIESYIEYTLSLSGPDETISMYANALSGGRTLNIRHQAGKVLQVEITKDPSPKA